MNVIQITAQVTEATPDAPYLALKLEFSPNQILEVLHDFELQVLPNENRKRAMFVSQMDSPLLDAVTRLARLLDNPKDISALAPLYTEEILYRVSQGQNGDILKGIAIEESSIRQIRDVIEHIMDNYDRSFRIEVVAAIFKDRLLFLT
ncbi:hypothetical protein J2Z22_001767 [Paenibacillus forsythiae]|uniref:Transcription regulator HTH AraC N-terminal domain-containing protein n=1 Tax=Paenibacillus forsythiae TaxID=365616 RepID=A0ABU3H706_9BACL|nr:AraC family transcriptional regulator [Paenibacillus forsythiae]MDT3426241.1 hypothetical protein [Paenibacillus forsythiae]